MILFFHCRNWNKELKKKNPSFSRATFNSFGHHMIFSFILFFFEEVFLKNIQPLMLAKVIEFFIKHNEEQYFNACLNAAGVVGASMLYVLCHHPACCNAMHFALKVRVAWCTLMYKKVILKYFQSNLIISFFSDRLLLMCYE